MPGQQEQPQQRPANIVNSDAAQNTDNENPVIESFNEVVTGNEDEVLNKGELTNNDGSVVETLDTAFHDEPGTIKNHSSAGSNRADYLKQERTVKATAKKNSKL